ncbi:MAG: hypothetical protein HYZ16_00600 [Bacteroidetes bacterium]|nr:hypothetical protein [Bacteroidota bacterium]
MSQYHMEDDTVYGLTFTERLDTTTADTAQKMVLAATEFCDATHYRYCDKLGFDSLINLKTPIYLEKMRLLSGSCNPDIPVEVSLLKDKIE